MRKRIIIELNKKRICLNFNTYEMDLIVKCLWLGYNNTEKEQLLFDNKDNDKNKLYYLHRYLSSKANKFFYNKINNDYYIFNQVKINKCKKAQLE